MKVIRSIHEYQEGVSPQRRKDGPVHPSIYAGYDLSRRSFVDVFGLKENS